jgi:hypothetical protein
VVNSQLILDLFEADPSVAKVELIGSRARGDATPFSDWDFGLEVHDFPSFSRDIGLLVAPLLPLAQQWDRLSETKCYMLIVPGPTKVDFLFPEVPNEKSPPWTVDKDSLNEVDAHFWDWMLWLASKQFRGNEKLVHGELQKLFGHLLQPMLVEEVPESISDAIEVYKRAREKWETKFQISTGRELQNEVEPLIH